MFQIIQSSVTNHRAFHFNNSYNVHCDQVWKPPSKGFNDVWCDHCSYLSKWSKKMNEIKLFNKMDKNILENDGTPYGWKGEFHGGQMIVYNHKN